MIRLLVSLMFAIPAINVFAQCPVNIGFEVGDFTNWECFLGTATTQGPSLGLSAATLNRHTAIKSAALAKVDPLGLFSVYPPNGSKYSIRLGNSQTAAGAERISYTFRIPDGATSYSILYHYAVVMQSPGHPPEEQPKFTAKVFDVGRDEYIGCSSFEFIADIGLPGFRFSTVDPTVLIKEWTPVTLKLNNRAGSVIRLEFTTQDCTRGGHYGYAYVDVDENCSSAIRGNQYCFGDTSLTLIAPSGFQRYKWYSPDFSRLVDTTPSLHFAPPPAPNTPFAVVVQPYPQLGCIDTLYTTIQYSPDSVRLVIKDFAEACSSTGVDITALADTLKSSPSLTFSYFQNQQLTTYLTGPDEVKKSGTYYIKATDANGCVAAKPTKVVIYPMPDTIKIPVRTPEIFVPYTYDITKAFEHVNGISYSYWMDSATTMPVSDPASIDKKGTYFIKYQTDFGCSRLDSLTLDVLDARISIDSIPNAFSPNEDGVNDLWQIPILKLFPDCVLDIYTRGGNAIFHSPGYNTPWDGKYNNRYVPVGTYYYVIRFGKRRAPIGGSVTVIR